MGGDLSLLNQTALSDRLLQRFLIQHATVTAHVTSGHATVQLNGATPGRGNGRVAITALPNPRPRSRPVAPPSRNAFAAKRAEVTWRNTRLRNAATSLVHRQTAGE